MENGEKGERKPMGEYAARLQRKLASQAPRRTGKKPHRLTGNKRPSGVQGVAELIKTGLDPCHAAYAHVNNLAMQFAETVSGFPEMRKWADVVTKAEREYLPAGPPMSPLTRSYFWTWALYDLQLGGSTDTMAYCLIASNDMLRLSAEQLQTLKALESSRMGIYEQTGHEGRSVLLRELITGSDLYCHCPAGYSGRKGDLWYVRLLPPLEPETSYCWVAMTTPYILVGTPKAEWVSFLERNMVHGDGPNESTRLHNLLKFGLEPSYWHEFVMKAYHNHRKDAVFLTGIPDRQNTLPHA
jgi:hypothetical protein